MQQHYYKRHNGQTNWPIMHVHIFFSITTVPNFLAVTNFHCDSFRLLPDEETEEMRLKTNWEDYRGHGGQLALSPEPQHNTALLCTR